MKSVNFYTVFFSDLKFNSFFIGIHQIMDFYVLRNRNKRNMTGEICALNIHISEIQTIVDCHKDVIPANSVKIEIKNSIDVELCEIEIYASKYFKKIVFKTFIIIIIFLKR